jgi:hypothetical protein
MEGRQIVGPNVVGQAGTSAKLRRQLIGAADFTD